MRCPMPLVLAKLGIEELSDGEELKVLASDPEASIDIAAWAADEGHGLRERKGRAWTEFVVRKRDGGSAG
jgi:TusA-related sulfurtransferase